LFTAYTRKSSLLRRLFAEIGHIGLRQVRALGAEAGGDVIRHRRDLDIGYPISA
jgi:hypothetical protein